MKLYGSETIELKEWALGQLMQLICLKKCSIKI